MTLRSKSWLTDATGGIKMRLSLQKRGVPLDGKRRLNPTYMIALQKLTPTSTPIGYAEAIQLLKDNPIFGGLQLRLPWITLESSFGVYEGTGWAEFEGFLSDLGNLPASQGGPRKASVLFDVKRFDVLYDLVPPYMRDGINGFYGDGQFDYDASPGFAGGRNVKFQNANVRARLNALLAEFGRRYANDPRIELIGFPEATPGTTPSAYYPAYNENAHLAGVLECLQSLAVSMPYTIVRQLCNYTRAGMATFVPNLVAAGIPAFGNPDAVMDEPGLGINTTPGIYQHQQTYGAKGTNAVAVISEVQRANYAHTTLLVALSPDPTWGPLTLADNGGALQLVGAGAHGVPTTATETVNTTGCGASLYVQSAAGNFPAVSYLKILSVDSATAMTVTNKSAWSSPTLAALGLNFSHVASRSLTDPWAGIRKANATTAYPLGSGFTYTPNSNTYAGFVPLISEIMGFLDTDIKPTHVIFTYNTDVNTRTGRSNIDCVVDYLNSFSGKNNIHGNLWTTRPDNCN